MVYAYAAMVTIAVAAVVIIGPMWLRGGSASVISSGPWLIQLLAGLIVIMVLLALALQQPIRQAVLALLAGGSATVAGYWLYRIGTLSRWVRVTLGMVVVLGCILTIVVLIGGLH